MPTQRKCPKCGSMTQKEHLENVYYQDRYKHTVEADYLKCHDCGHSYIIGRQNQKYDYYDLVPPISVIENFY